jgi:hypothetical protein
MTASKSAVTEPLVLELSGMIAVAMTAGKEGNSVTGFDLLLESVGVKHGLEHLEVGVLLVSTAPLVVLAAPVCPGHLELGVVGSRR